MILIETGGNVCSSAEGV